eukprot:g2692.t1
MRDRVSVRAKSPRACAETARHISMNDSLKKYIQFIRSKLVKEMSGSNKKAIAGAFQRFQSFDNSFKAKSTIAFPRFRNSLRNIGLNVRENIAKKLFNFLDTNHDNLIQFSEFSNGIFEKNLFNKKKIPSSRNSSGTEVGTSNPEAKGLNNMKSKSFNDLRLEHLESLKVLEKNLWKSAKTIEEKKRKLLSRSDNPNASDLGEASVSIQKETEAAFAKAKICRLKRQIATRAFRLSKQTGHSGDYAFREYLKSVARKSVAARGGNNIEDITVESLGNSVMQLTQVKQTLRYLGFFNDVSSEQLFRSFPLRKNSNGKEGISFEKFTSMVLGKPGAHLLLKQAKKDADAQMVRKDKCSAPKGIDPGGAARVIFKIWEEAEHERISKIEERERKEKELAIEIKNKRLEELAQVERMKREEEERERLLREEERNKGRRDTTIAIRRAIEQYKKAKEKLLTLEDGNSKSSKLTEYLYGGSTENDKIFLQNLQDEEKLAYWWSWMDVKRNGICSLSEVDNFICHVNGFETFNNKSALIEAYKYSTASTDWVNRKEFPLLLRNIYYFNKLWNIFSSMNSRGDRRIDKDEFHVGIHRLGARLSKSEANAEFGKIDSKGDGFILFHEFVKRIADMAIPIESLATLSGPKFSNRKEGISTMVELPKLNLKSNGSVEKRTSKTGASKFNLPWKRNSNNKITSRSRSPSKSTLYSTRPSTARSAQYTRRYDNLARPMTAKRRGQTDGSKTKRTNRWQ